MYRRLWILLPLAAALMVGGATASQVKAWPYPIGLTVSGPKTVAPNVATKRYVIVRNNTTHVFRKLNLLFTPRTLIIKCRKRFTTVKLQVYAPRTSALWKFRNLRLRPHRSMKIPVTLMFPATNPVDGSSKIGILLDGKEIAKEGAISSGSVVMHIVPTG